MKLSKLVLTIVAFLFVTSMCAQDLQADNMLLFQRRSGGWPKQFQKKAIDYKMEFTASDIKDERSTDDATIDNKATTKEIRYLVKAFKETNNAKYLVAAEKGIRYLLKAQYKNGGWPQFYPDKSGYRSQITFNDNAIINVLNVLNDVVLKRNDLDVVDQKLTEQTAQAIAKGIDCILKTQITVNGKLTGWCQQYDESTLKPAKARAYELPSIAGSETVAIVDFLISQPNPSAEMKTSIHAAVAWLELVKIPGYKYMEVQAPEIEGLKERKLVADSTSTVWARYYEMGTNRPFFSDRDGVVKYTLKEVGYERRNGYAWYGEWGKNLLGKKYPDWEKKNK